MRAVIGLLILATRLTAVVLATIGGFSENVSLIAWGIFLLMWANTVAWNEFASQFAKTIAAKLKRD
jgi:xanthine/uracil/vitamin C permease (AzgA family)